MIKKIFTLPLALLLTLVISRAYFHAGFPYTHDGENHLARFANYKIAIKEGQIPPRFAPNLMNHYGYPVFNYNYPLANILSLPFSFLKINYELTFKILATLFIFIGLSGVYHWLNRLQVSYKAMLFGTAVYATSPFIWSAVLFRGNIGEIMAWGIFPWLLYLIEALRSGGKWTYSFKTVILVSFLLSHNISVLFGLPIVFLYAWVRHQKNSIFWMRFFSLLGLAMALTLWFWLPAVAEKNLINVGQAALVNNFAQHFPTLAQLIHGPLQFGFSLPGSIDTMSFAIGAMGWLTLVLSGIMMLKIFLKKSNKFLNSEHRLWLLFFRGGILLTIFQLGFTAPLWKAIPLVSFIQFPWRLSMFWGVTGAGLGALLWSKINNSVRWLLIGILTLQLLSFTKLKPVDYFHHSNIDYDAFTQSTSTSNENLPKTFNYLGIADWQPSPQIASGGGDIKVNYWSGSSRQYQVVVNAPVTIIEPTINFAGWETMSLFEGQNSIVNYIDNEQIKGRLAYRLNTPGTYEITTKFTQKTWPRIIGNGVSIIAFILSLILFFKRFFKKELNFYLSWKIFLFFIGMAAPLFLIYQPSFPHATLFLKNSELPSFIYSWANFDGVHYLTIIDQGYLKIGLIQAFFPLYPILVKSLTRIIHSPILAGLSLNFVVGFLLLKVWKKIVDLEIDVETHNWPVYLLFLFPTAFFLNSFYSETLFLFLVLASFLSARRGHWTNAGLLAALASATRLVGIFLVPALLVELWLQKTAQEQAWGNKSHSFPSYFHQRYAKQIRAILVGTLGLIAYMVYLQLRFHDPLYFYHVQAEFGVGRQESIILYPQVVWRYLKILWTVRPFDLKYYAYVQEFLFGILGLIGVIWSWFKVRKSYVVFSALAFLLPTLTGTFSSLPRYFLASFSVLILLVKILEKKPVLRKVWLVISTIWLIFNTVLFIQGYWVA